MSFSDFDVLLACLDSSGKILKKQVKVQTLQNEVVPGSFTNH
jgi:hypothetical protein